jgi:hypothetical protein
MNQYVQGQTYREASFAAIRRSEARRGLEPANLTTSEKG